MTISYDILFRLRLRHEFYTDGFTRDFELAPTPACQRLLRQLGMLFRQEDQGFTVLARIQPRNAGQAPVLFRSVGPRSLRFAFEMKLRNPYFHNITDLPGFNPGSNFFYFSNLRSDTLAGLPYLGDQIANARLGQPLGLISGFTHNLNFGRALQNAAIQLSDGFGNAKGPVPQLALSGNNETPSFQIDLRPVQNLTAGRYRTHWIGTGSSGNDSGQADFVLEPGLRPDQSFGLIEIFSHTNDLTHDPALAVPFSHRFLNGDTLVRAGAQNDVLVADYQIQFSAHPPVRWHYVLIKNTPAAAPPTLNTLTIANFTATNVPEYLTVPGSRVLRSDNDINVRQNLPAFALQNAGLANFEPTLPQPAMASNLKRISGQTPFYELYYYV